MIDKNVPCLTICDVCDLQPMTVSYFLHLEHCIQSLNADNGFWTFGLWNEKHHCIKVLSGNVLQDRSAVWDLDPYWTESRHPKISIGYTGYWIYLKHKALITCNIKQLTKIPWQMQIKEGWVCFARDGSVSRLLVREQLATVSHRKESCCRRPCCRSWWEDILIM